MRSVGSDRPVSVLFVCFDNAVMSILAESILRSLRSRRFTVASAALEPAAAVSPLVVDFLRDRSMPVDGLRPKSLRELCNQQRFDFVITLCERSAAAAAPDCDEDAVMANWSLDALSGQLQDPRYALDAVRDAFWILMRRIKIFASLPHHAVPRHSIRYRVEGIATWN